MVAVSLVIPVYNTSKYLEKCLDSILVQSFSDFEVICVDDGSTDDSVQIIELYQEKDSRIKLIKEAHNGVGNARNRGLEFSKGEFIQFLDSDDFFEPNMLEKMYDSAMQNSADMVVCSAQRVDEKDVAILDLADTWPINKKIAPIKTPFNWKDNPDIIIGAFAPEPWIALYKRELFLQNQLKFSDMGSSNGACLGYIIRLLAKKIIVLDDKFINYRYCRENSITSKKILFTGMNMIIQRLKFKEYLIANGLLEILCDAWDRDFRARLIYVLSNLKTEEEFLQFCTELRAILGSAWKEYESFIYKYFLKMDKLLDIIGDKRVFLWGASMFLRRILSGVTEKSSNILGIIDKNSNFIGSKIGYYEVFAPDILKTVQADAVLITVVNNRSDVRYAVEGFLREYYPDVELLPDIFDC